MPHFAELDPINVNPEQTLSKTINFFVNDFDDESW